MKAHFLGFAIPFVLALVAHAQPSPGSYTYDFYTTNLPLFEVQGTFGTNTGTVSDQFTLELTPRGRFRGNYLGHYDDGAVIVDMSGKVGGSFSGMWPDYRIVMTERGPVRGTASGRPISGAQSVRVTLDVNAVTGNSTGTTRATVCLAGYHCRTTVESSSLDVFAPGPDEGDWSLTLTISNRNNRISGTAQATVSSGRVLEFRVRGSYSPSDATCKFVLRGVSDAAGVVLHLTTDGQMNLASLRGKLFGQELELPSAGP